MNFLQKLFWGVKTEKVTIKTIEEGDIIVATAHDSWFLNKPNEPKKTLDIYPNDKGKVVKVDKSMCTSWLFGTNAQIVNLPFTTCQLKLHPSCRHADRLSGMSQTNDERKEGVKMKMNWLTRKKNRFMAWAHKMFLKIKQKLNIKIYWGKAAQRHHDFWVFKYRQANGKLIAPDMEQ